MDVEQHFNERTERELARLDSADALRDERRDLLKGRRTLRAAAVVLSLVAATTATKVGFGSALAIAATVIPALHVVAVLFVLIPVERRLPSELSSIDERIRELEASPGVGVA